MVLRIQVFLVIVLLSFTFVPRISAGAPQSRTTASPTTRNPAPRSISNPPERTHDLDQLGKLQRLTLRPSLYIKCGGPGFIDEGGIVWQSDVGLSKAATYGDSAGHGLSLIPQLYRSGRNSRKGQIEYHLPLPLGSYTVTFHFMDLYQRHAGKSLFDIEMEGGTAFKNIDIVRQVGSGNPLKVSKDVELYDGVLDITVRAWRGTASLSAFSITPAYP